MVEADVEVEAAAANCCWIWSKAASISRCTIDLKTGEATLSAAGIADYAPTAKTSVAGQANIASRSPMSTTNCCCGSTATWSSSKAARRTTSDQVFGDRSRILPQTSDDDPRRPRPGRHRRARREAERDCGCSVWRDIYYIADSWERNRVGDLVTDFDHPLASAAARLAVRAVAVESFRRAQSRRLPAGRGSVLRDGRQQRRKLRRAAVAQRRPAAAASPAARIWNADC